MRGTEVFCGLFIGFFPAMVLTGEIDMSWWGAALVSVGLGLIVLLVGTLGWSIAAEARHDTERLKKFGRAAVA